MDLSRRPRLAFAPLALLLFEAAPVRAEPAKAPDIGALIITTREFVVNVWLPEKSEGARLFNNAVRISWFMKVSPREKNVTGYIVYDSSNFIYGIYPFHPEKFGPEPMAMPEGAKVRKAFFNGTAEWREKKELAFAPKPEREGNAMQRFDRYLVQRAKQQRNQDHYRAMEYYLKHGDKAPASAGDPKRAASGFLFPCDLDDPQTVTHLQQFSESLESLQTPEQLSAGLQDFALEAGIEERARQGERLAQETDTAWDDFKRSPAFQELQQLKSGFLSFAENLAGRTSPEGKMPDGLQKQAEELLNTYDQFLETKEAEAPSLKRLAELATDLAQMTAGFDQVGRAVAQRIALTRRAQRVEIDLGNLRKRQAQLEEQRGKLQGVLATQTDPEVVAHNQRILAKAGELLADAAKRIAQLEEQKAADGRAAADRTGIADQAQALQEYGRRAQGLRDRWIRTAARIRDAAARAEEPFYRSIQTKVTEFSGPVEVSHGDGTSAAPGAAGALRPGDTVKTGGGARATMRLPDGARLEMGQRSSFSLLDKAKEYVVDGTLRWVEKFEKSAAANTRRRLRTQGVNVAVRGTDLIVHVEQARTRILVSSGEIELEIPGHEDSVVLRGGQKAMVEKGRRPGEPQGLEEVEYLQWRAYVSEGL